MTVQTALHRFVFALLLSTATLPSLATADGPDYWRVRALKGGDELNIRERPTVVAKIVASAPSGARGLKNLGCRQIRRGANAVAKGLTRWCRVEYKGHVGWAAQAFLEEDTEPQPAAAAGGGTDSASSTGTGVGAAASTSTATPP